MQHEGADEQYPHEQGRAPSSSPQHQQRSAVAKPAEIGGTNCRGLALIDPGGTATQPAPTHVEQLGDETLPAAVPATCPPGTDHYRPATLAPMPLLKMSDPNFADPGSSLPYGVAFGFRGAGRCHCSSLTSSKIAAENLASSGHAHRDHDGARYVNTGAHPPDPATGSDTVSPDIGCCGCGRRVGYRDGGIKWNRSAYPARPCPPDPSQAGGDGEAILAAGH